jgi:predicted MFS family arabinose efflux permease
MNNKIRNIIKDLKTFILLWLTQALSSLGSAMTSFALIVWSYEQQGSALITALLSVCSYAPYVVLSIFAGALSDKWNKKLTMLFCDVFAAMSSVVILLLLQTGRLEVWHLYVLNAVNGLMNTVQQPTSEVAMSLLVKKEHYQRVSGMRSFSNSLTTILTPAIATAVLALAGMKFVIIIDLFTFFVAFTALAFFIKLPEVRETDVKTKESVWKTAKSGLRYLNVNRGILELILFLAAINFTASMYNAALPAMLMSRSGGGKAALGIVNSVTGLANIIGSLLITFGKKPKSRVATICNTLMFSMGTENFILALGRNVPTWCFGAVLGWIFIPMMGANMDVLLRSNIPLDMQGRVYSARNTLQFFTIPLGYFLGGVFVDCVFEPLMAVQRKGSLLQLLFGSGKGSGAALFFMVIGFVGVITCLLFRRCKAMWLLEDENQQ